MMKIYKSDRESGVALVFAIGLLGLMLAVGIAFVGNAILFKKVAANNSARTQARMLAISAANRAAAAVMLYQQHFVLTESNNLTFPVNFNNIYSAGAYDKNDGKSANSYGSGVKFTDGLTKKSDSDSLMKLPLDNGVVSKSFASEFNTKFSSGSSWDGSWVFFYNTHDENDSEREIIGRAAWQVVSSNAQILAPVFLRGDLTGLDPNLTNGFAPGDSFVPRNARWGREIDEVYLPDSGVFANLNFPPTAEHDDEYGSLLDYESVYNAMLGSGQDNPPSDLKKWIHKWFIPDPEEGTVLFPTQMFAEVYTYKPGGSKSSRQYMRFNISELSNNYAGNDINTFKRWYERYDVSSDSDQWYARFGITQDSEKNSESAIRKLTLDSVVHSGEEYDWEFEASERPGLPFLRRIGNADENITFKKYDANAAATKDMDSLRKQIAANFNDYCDSDSIPTSDVAAKDWLTSATQPTFTGNEKTPYIYEVALKLDMVEAPGSENRGVKIAGEIVENENVKLTFGKNGIKIAPVMKLANVYNFDPSGVFDSMRGYVDFDKMNMWYRLEKITLKNVTFSYTDANGIRVPKTMEKIELVYGETDEDEMDCFKDVSLRNTDVDSLNDLVLKSEFTFNTESDIPDNERGAAFLADDVNNSSGAKQYPRKTAEKWQTATDANSVLKLCKNDFTTELKDGDTPVNQLTAKLDYETVKKLKQAAGLNLPDTVIDFKLESIGSVFVDKISVLAGAFQLRRMVLTGKNGETSHGVDYVRKFEKPLIFHLSKDNIEDDKLKFEFKDGIATTQGILVGGIRNFDPRQNLNPEDWFPYDSAVAADWHPDPAKAADGEGNLQIVKAANITADDELSQVMDSAANTRPAQNSNGGAVAATLNDIEINDALFTPKNSDSSLDKDLETVTEPAYAGETSYISTAVIRNAPMMSPWEIGFIHRGIAWQTVNIKTAGNPGGGELDSLAAYAGNSDDGETTTVVWNNPGTKYQDGDGAVLELIKMTDRCASYGRINVNMLNVNHPEYDPVRDPDIVKALFNNIRYNTPALDFIAASTRGSDGKFPNTNPGTAIDLVNINNSICDARSNLSNGFVSRTHFLNFETGSGNSLQNAFGAASVNNTDAAQEEIIGKTINLLTADTLSPAIVQIVVVAQSIKDHSGTQIRVTSETNNSKLGDPNDTTTVHIEDGTVVKDCIKGRFDMFEHTDNSDKNVYFDEITGEVKALVTFIRDPLTGRMSISKIEYIE